MSDKKVSVVILGNEDVLKKSLIMNILGKDITPSKPSDLKHTEIYENDTFEITCTPNLDTQCDDIRNVFDSNQHHDMSLLVVEDGLSAVEVLKQIVMLHEITGKPTEEFKVMLPFKYEVPLSIYSPSQVFSELTELTAERQQMSTNNRRVDHPQSRLSTPHKLKGITGKHGVTTVNLVLLGTSGAGKSASGNTILREERFKSSPSSKSVTTECQEAETERNGTHIRVIDTPDIFDDEIDSSVKDKHVTKCKDLCQSEPCVYLLVMQVSRFTDGERDILTKLEKAFGSNAHEQTVILFTRGDDLKRDDISLEKFLHSCQPDLRKIVEKCDSRCVVFENKMYKSYQVKELMETVYKLLKEQQNVMGM